MALFGSCTPLSFKCQFPCADPPLLRLSPDVSVRLSLHLARAHPSLQVLSTRPWVLPASRTGIKFEDHFAAVMTKMTAAIKMGGLVVREA